MRFLVWATAAFLVVFGAAAWLMNRYTDADLSNYIALVAAGVACAAWVQVSRSANADTKTARQATAREPRR